jgi:hypothetical protein
MTKSSATARTSARSHLCDAQRNIRSLLTAAAAGVQVRHGTWTGQAIALSCWSFELRDSPIAARWQARASSIIPACRRPAAAVAIGKV